jgi:plastocyanin
MRITLMSLIAAVVLTLAACSSEPPSAAEVCPSPTDTTSVEIADFSYTPGCVAADAGTTLELRNTGDAPHTFTVNETEIDVEVDAGGTDTVDLAGVAPGTYEVVCTLHPQMEAALQIR